MMSDENLTMWVFFIFLYIVDHFSVSVQKDHLKGEQIPEQMFVVLSTPSYE